MTDQETLAKHANDLLMSILVELREANARSARLEANIKQMNQETETLKKETKVVRTLISEESKEAHDWFKLKNGMFAKVPKKLLTGTIYQEDGQSLIYSEWNPLSLKSLFPGNKSEYDIVERKSGDNPEGWPEWTK